MKQLSKTRLIAHRQCPKRMWLEMYKPKLRKDTPDTLASFDVGHTVGDIASYLYDPEQKGVLFNANRDGFPAALRRSLEQLNSDLPLFEAGYSTEGAYAFADVMLPVVQNGQRMWRMIEVKSSTGVKEYHRDDVAIQAYVARHAGVPLQSIALAHIDNSFVYSGQDDYRGLLKECDLTEVLSCIQT